MINLQLNPSSLSVRELAPFSFSFYDSVLKVKVKVKVKVTLRLMVSQSVSLGIEPHLRLVTRYLLLFDNYCFVFGGGALSHERTGLSSVHAAGPFQRSLSRVRVPW
jgi:hypothetical protein